LLGPGFTICDSTASGFSLLAMHLEASGTAASFCGPVRRGERKEKNGLFTYWGTGGSDARHQLLSLPRRPVRDD
jgi:hypothetical protein